MKNEEQNIEKQEGNGVLPYVRRSYSKTYKKGYEITDDALIFINDMLQEMTLMNENGHREFKAKVRITFNYA